MNKKSLMIFSLMLLASFSLFMSWLSSIELVYTEAYDVKMVTKTKVTPESPIKAMVTFSIGSDKFFLGRTSFTISAPETTIYSYNQSLITVNGTNIIDSAKNSVPNATYFQTIISIEFHITNGKYVDTSNASCEVEYDAGNIHCCYTSAIVMENKAMSQFYVSVWRKISSDPSKNIYPIRVNVIFIAHTLCWSEKQHLVEYQEPELVTVEVHRHLFGDNPTPGEGIYDNGFARILCNIATLLSILTLAALLTTLKLKPSETLP